MNILYFFFNPQESVGLTEYEGSKFTLNGNVDNVIYKVWDSFYGKDVESFITPNTQDYIKLNAFGKLDFIEVHKTIRIGRNYVENVPREKGGTEQPISYYRQFCSGGTKFYYDDKQRLIRYVIDEKYKFGSPRYYEANFRYDEKNNRYSLNQTNKREYNNNGQLVLQRNLDESDEYYDKIVYEYDSEGRVNKILEYGYLCDYDDSGSGNHVYHLDKGIHLLLSQNTTTRR